LRPLALRTNGFDELNAIAEWIADVDAVQALPDFVSACSEPCDEGVQVAAPQRAMRLARRAKVQLHAEMNFQLTALAPTAAALSKVGRFLRRRNPESSVVQRACEIFASGGHRQLHAIQTRHAPGRDHHTPSYRREWPLPKCNNRRRIIGEAARTAWQKRRA
jgi:hypothetical protein